MTATTEYRYVNGCGMVAGAGVLLVVSFVAVALGIAIVVGLLGPAPRPAVPPPGPGRDVRLASAPGPSPTLDEGASSILAGVATWCAPTATHCHGWAPPAKLGAVPGYDGTPYLARVSRGSRSVVVRVVSFCACGDRAGKSTVIDLSPAAFVELAPLSAGVIDVTVERLDGIALPPTDTAP